MEGVCYQEIFKSPAQVDKDSGSKRKMIFERFVLHRAIEPGALYEKNYKRCFIQNNKMRLHAVKKAVLKINSN